MSNLATRTSTAAVTLLVGLAYANAGGRCWPEANFVPREIAVVVGSKARPLEGEPYGIVYGSFGSAGTDLHLYSRRLIVRMVGTNSVAVWGGGANAIYMTTPLGKLFNIKPDVTCVLEDGQEVRAGLSGYMFNLKPGEYEVASLGINRHLNQGSRLMLGSEADAADYLEVGLRFKVEEGAAVYLGELLTAVGREEGREFTFFELRDHIERDKYIASRRAPLIASLASANLVGEMAKVAPNTIRLRPPVAAASSAASGAR